MYSNWGRLFTHPEYQGRGFGNETMDATERFVFDEQYADLSLLFCLDALRNFYRNRGWQPVEEPVLPYAANRIC
mgnify:CR=1 FL=1